MYVTLKVGREDEGEGLAERRFVQESGKGRVYELANKEYAGYVIEVVRLDWRHQVVST